MEDFVETKLWGEHRIDFPRRFLAPPQTKIAETIVQRGGGDLPALKPSRPPGHGPENMAVVKHMASNLVREPGARFAAPSAEFPLGTDWYGRDLLSRVLTGAQSTILLAILATAIGTVAGTLVGVVSGYLGGWADDAIMRLTDAVMAIPSLLFALMLLAVLGSSA